MLEENDLACPFCGELFTYNADTTQGSYTTIEDCTVCCRPLLIRVECQPGEIISISAERS